MMSYSSNKRGQMSYSSNFPFNIVLIIMNLCFKLHGYETLLRPLKPTDIIINDALFAITTFRTNINKDKVTTSAKTVTARQTKRNIVNIVDNLRISSSLLVSSLLTCSFYVEYTKNIFPWEVTTVTTRAGLSSRCPASRTRRDWCPWHWSQQVREARHPSSSP